VAFGGKVKRSRCKGGGLYARGTDPVLRAAAGWETEEGRGVWVGLGVEVGSEVTYGCGINDDRG